MALPLLTQSCSFKSFLKSLSWVTRPFDSKVKDRTNRIAQEKTRALKQSEQTMPLYRFLHYCSEVEDGEGITFCTQSEANTKFKILGCMMSRDQLPWGIHYVFPCYLLYLEMGSHRKCWRHIHRVLMEYKHDKQIHFGIVKFSVCQIVGYASLHIHINYVD